MASDKDRDDEAYEEGVRNGQNADFFDQAVNSLTKSFSLDPRLNDIYQKGYQYGVTHRPVSDDRSKSEQAARRQEPVRRVREASSDLPDTSNSNDNGCAHLLGWLIGAAILIWLIVWLAANVVLPLALLNSALLLSLSGLIYRQRQVLLASLALVGGGYMLVDIANGWLSTNFVNNVVKNPEWLTGFVYANALAVAVSAWLLLNRTLSSVTSNTTNDRARVLLRVASVAIAGALGGLMPVIYHRGVYPLRAVGADPNIVMQRAVGVDEQQANNSVCGESLAFLDRFRDIDTRRLPVAHLAGLSLSQLGFLRNYIYARHGRAFAKRTYEKCFSQFSWYHVNPAYHDGLLNSVEQANIAALLNQERTHELAERSTAKTFKGAWFEIAVPPSFTTTPSMKSSTSAEGYDSALFRSPDGNVEFYIFSPQWKGEPSDIALNPSKEKQTSYRSETSRQRTVTWFTIEANDGSYTRTYQDTIANDGSTRWVVGVKYANQSAFDPYRDQYAKFKKSLRQFAD